MSDARTRADKCGKARTLFALVVASSGFWTVLLLVGLGTDTGWGYALIAGLVTMIILFSLVYIYPGLRNNITSGAASNTASNR
ncbi:hypothetical protein SAMN05421759_12519 [Roseivivax lentus]|uniref:Uncharacterized protein n=1 Tax=Roseivivax lentus TaxID=633194 RepID=A0A1N7Q2F0_9RHOB|nr:hypothetical protein [Roseivivax lentus]SIT17016.1 hypothetical protein SAMN05421759_12519 [Roseivivax lentus]